MIVSRDGEVWVSPDVTMRLPSQLAASLAPRRWVVLGRDGRPVGAATTPAGFRLFDATADWIIGVHQDELGVESVRAYGVGR